MSSIKRLSKNKFAGYFMSAAVILGSFIVPGPAQASQVPAACTNNDFVLNLGQNQTVVYDETSPYGADTITYTVSTGNPNVSGSGCNVDDVDVTVTTPDGVIHPVQSGGSYPIGTAVTVLGTINYLVDSSDKTGSVVIATANAAGLLHDNPQVDDPLDITKQVSALVINPSTNLSITASAPTTTPGGTVDLTVTEANDGNSNLNNVHVDINNGIGSLSTTSPNFSGDDGDGVLEPGETWAWSVPGVAIASTTTFTATGFGTDVLGTVVTFPDDQEEQDAVTVTVVFNPTTITTISSSAATTTAGGTVDLTITEQNDGDVPLTGAHVDVDNGVGTLSAPPTSGDDGDAILEPGETWSWTVNGVVVNADTTFTATGHGLDPLLNDITYPADQDEQDSVSVDVINPTTITTITSSVATTTASSTVTLTVTEQNDGDVALTGAYVTVDNGVGQLSTTSPNFSGDDGDGILEPGETWSWTVDVVINGAITYTATGHGLDPLLNDVTYPADPEEQDSVAIAVQGFEGCTPGYWKQTQHFDSWTTYLPTQTFSSVFGETITINWSAKGKPAPVSDPTLLQALEANGGGINALARHAVAALLDSSNPDVDYAYTTAQVISMFQAANPSGDISGTANLFSTENERGCPLN